MENYTPPLQVQLKRLMTPTNFAWFLVAVLGVILLILAVNSMQKISGGGKKAYPHDIIGLSSSLLRQYLGNPQTTATLVTLYTSDNCEYCDEQLEALLNLRSLEKERKLKIYAISTDANPEDTAKYLMQKRIPESFTTYYAAPQTMRSISIDLEQMGSTNIRRERKNPFPHTMLFNERGKLIVEYSGYVRSEQVVRTLKLYALRKK
jgi:thioredoxin-related protein